MASTLGSVFSWASGQPRISPQQRKAAIDNLYKAMKEAQNYDEWKDAAEGLDELEGNNEWKRLKTSALFDHHFLQERLKQMQTLEAQDRLPSLVNWIRSGLQRNLAGTGNIELYENSHIGTKGIIEQHHEALVRMLRRVAESNDTDEMPLEKRLAFFAESRHALGKTALLLSGGIHLGMYHLGVVKALHHQQLLPRIISGSSAGAVIAAIVGVCSDEELGVLTTHGLQAFCTTFLQEKVVDERTAWRRVITTGHMMDVGQLQQGLKQLIGDFTLHEAYERTGRIVNITVSPDNAFEKPRLLNYLTAPNVLLWSAATASCATPGQQQQSQLFVKGTDGAEHPYSLRYQLNGVKGKWPAEEMNGGPGLHTDLPMNRLQELFNVNFFVVSQTNPHAIPFLQQHQKKVPVKGQRGQGQRSLVGRVVGSASSLLLSEVKHRCQQAITLGMAPRLLKLTMEQKYTGDVTIVPELSLEHYLKLVNVTEASMASFVQQGERSTWPFLSQIRGQCQLEFVLDECTRKVAAAIQEHHHAARAPSQPRSTPQCHLKSDIHSSFCDLQQTEAAEQAAQQQQQQESEEDGDRVLQSPFTPSFRQQRHTHLDLNDFFSSSGSTETQPGDEKAPRKKLGHTGNLAAITSFTVESFDDAAELPRPGDSNNNLDIAHPADGLAINPQARYKVIGVLPQAETCA